MVGKGKVWGPSWTAGMASAYILLQNFTKGYSASTQQTVGELQKNWVLKPSQSDQVAQSIIPYHTEYQYRCSTPL